MRSVIKKLLIVLTSLIVVLVLTLLVISWLYRGSVEREVIAKLKENIPAEIKYESSSFWFNPGYGGYTLTLKGVSIESGKKQGSFLKGGNLIFILSTQDFFSGKFGVTDLYLENDTLDFIIDKKGKSNFEKIFKLDKAKSDEDTYFDLKHIYFRNTQVNYQNLAQNFQYKVKLDKVNAEIENVVKGLNCTINGALKDLEFKQNNQTLFAQKEIKITDDSRLEYNRKNKKITFVKTKLQIKETEFLVEGDYEIKPKESKLNLTLKGMNENLGSLIAFLPENIYDKLAAYYTTEKGKIEFSGFIKGIWSKNKFPNVEINFGTPKNKDIIVHSKYNASRSIEGLRFTGKFSNGNKNNLASSSISIKNLQGKLAGQRFKGELSVVNFLNPKVDLFVEASIDLLAFSEFYQLDNVDKIRGGITVSLDYEGNLKDLDEEGNRVSGTLELDNISFKLAQDSKEFQNIRGFFRFNNNEVKIENFAGKMANTDFKIVGKMQNLIPYLFTKDAQVLLDASLFSKNLNLEDLLTSTDSKYQFALAPNISFRLKCKADKLSFRSFDANNLTGDLLLKNQELKTTNMIMDVAGGKMAILGLLNAEKKSFNTFDGRFIVENVEAKRLFKAFENFGSHFPLKDENIQGRLTADVRSGIVFDQKLDVKYPNLVADIESKMTQGTLRDFEFIKRAMEHIGERGLGRKLDFAEMKNILQIRNNSIFVSDTEIKSKLPLQVIGRSTPEKGLDYQIKIPNVLRRELPNTKSYIKDNNNRFTFYISVRGTSENPDAKDAKPSNPEKLEENWQRSKATYMKLFKKNQEFWKNSALQIDTVRTPYFE